MNEAEKSEEYLGFLKIYLERCPEAFIWVKAYVDYAHRIDDIIDKDKELSNDFILNTFRTAITLYTYPFYTQNLHLLQPLIYATHDSYRDSVNMERSGEDWQKNISDIIRQNANDVILMVILIVAGLDARNCAAIRLREIAYKQQHD